MGVAGEAELHEAREGIGELGHGMARTGEGFNGVGNGSGCGIEHEEETLAAFFDVHPRGGVDEAEEVGSADGLGDAGEAERPEADGVSLHGDDAS